ncbi:MAG: UvrD-helicase domain-containing protein, partial [Clostridia bacterium]|nr:UvrD-helicase domain-containing protein [Clostridia bacterium]
MKFTKEQLQAIESRGMSVAVSAAAGSGKTAVLTRRIIERVCAPDGDISRILAVTFTKAAAAEILARLSRAISEKLAEDPSDRHVARQSLLVSSARVSTVHRFCLDVIHEYFDKLGLPSDFTVGDETNIKIISEKVMDKLIDDLFEGNVSPDEKIDDFGLLYDTLGGRSKKNGFSETMMEIYEKLSCKTDFIDAIDGYIQMYKNIDASNIIDNAWVFEIKRYLRATLEHYRKMMCDAEKLGEVNPDYLPTQTAFTYDRRFCEFALSKLDTSGYTELFDVFASYDPPSISFARGAAKTAERERIHGFRDEFKNA